MGKTTHIGKADIDRIISESIDTVLKEKHGKNNRINESMKFNFKGFLGELAMLMRKYKVNIVNDNEGSYMEDEYGDTVLDFTDKFLSPEGLTRTAVQAK